MTRSDQNDTKPLMTVNDIKVHYEVRNEAGERVSLKAVDGVTFEVHRGQTVGIVGESGCGKSTLGRALVQIEELAGGSIQLGGVQISDLSEREMLQHRRQLQMIFQNPQASLNPRWKIGRSVQEPLRVHDNKSPEEQRASVLEQLDRVGLPGDIVDRYPHHLSGGQQQRVAIARALAASPDLVVCDEPVSALDVSIQAQITNLLVDIQAESGVAYVFIAHDLAVVRSISDVVLIMYLGKIVEKADSEMIFQRPRHPYTLALLSASPIPNAQIERHRDRIILAGDLPDPSNPPSGCRFRTRCSWARDLCTQVEPELRDMGDGHFVACHFHDELADEAIRFLPWVDQ